MLTKLKTIPSSLKRRLKTLSKNQQRITALVFALVIGATGQIVYSSFASTTEYSQIPAVAEMQKRTEEVVKLTDEYAKIPNTVSSKSGSKPNPTKATKKQELLVKIKARKTVYKKSIQYDPQTAANYFLPFATRDKLPSEAKADLEQIKVTKGTWTTLLTTNEKIDASKDVRTDGFLTYVTTEQGQDVYIYGDALPSISSGQSANLLGIVVDDTMAATLPATQSSVVTGSQTTSFVPQIFKSQRAHAQTITVDPNSTARICAIPEVVDFLTSWISDGWENIANNCYAQLSRSIGQVFCDEDRVCLGLADESIALTGDSGKRKALIVPIQFENDENLPISRDDLADTYQKVSNAYDRMSYGKFKPQYDVWQRWEKTSEDNTFDSCTEDNLAARQAAFKRVARSVVSKNEELENKILNDGYTDVMYAYSSMRCGDSESGLWGWAALGHSRGTNYVAESTMVLSSDTEDIYARLAGVMTHELGHSYGLGHAKGACNEGEPTGDPSQVDLSKFCLPEDAEYANTYDPMGNISDPDVADFSFANKLRLGWVSKDDTISASDEGGSYTIEALNKSSGKRSIKLRYKDRDLYIDYRPGTGLLNYFSNGDKTTSLIGSEIQKLTQENGNVVGYLWSYDSAGKFEPYRIGEGEDSICVTPSNATQSSITVKIDKNCMNISEIAPITSIGGEDAKGQSLPGVAATDPNVTQFRSNSSTCYDNKSKLWFVGDMYRVLVYGQSAIMSRTAKYVLGADTINEYKSYRAPGWWLSQTYAKNFYMDAAYDTKTAIPDKAIDDTTQWISCDNDENKVYVGISAGSSRVGKIVVYDYSAGLTSGMKPIAVLGQTSFSGQTNYDPPTASSLGGQNFSAYSDKHKILFVADYQNSRVLGFDMSGGISNNMPAKYVLGQKDFITRDATGSLARPINIALNEDTDEFMVDTVSGSRSTQIKRFKIQDVKDGKKDPYATFSVITGGTRQNIRSLHYDTKAKQIIVTQRNGISIYDDGDTTNPNSPALLASYTVDYGLYKEIYHGTYDPETRKLYTNAADTGSFGRNHRNIFYIPPIDESEYYRQLHY